VCVYRRRVPRPLRCPSWMLNSGVPADVFDGRPVIGIANSFSEFTPCNSHFRELAERVKIGVWEAGGFPLEFPTMSLGESTIRPTAMLYRNLMAMDVEVRRHVCVCVCVCVCVPAAVAWARDAVACCVGCDACVGTSTVWVPVL
jgi:dihydroxyacid dehydratase/phosphogluconate dehydratase